MFYIGKFDKYEITYDDEHVRAVACARMTKH